MAKSRKQRSLRRTQEQNDAKSRLKRGLDDLDRFLGVMSGSGATGDLMGALQTVNVVMKLAKRQNRPDLAKILAMVEKKLNAAYQLVTKSEATADAAQRQLKAIIRDMPR